MKINYILTIILAFIFIYCLTNTYNIESFNTKDLLSKAKNKLQSAKKKLGLK